MYILINLEDTFKNKAPEGSSMEQGDGSQGNTWLNQPLIEKKNLEESNQGNNPEKELETRGWPRWLIERFESRLEISKGPVIRVNNLSKSRGGKAVLKGFTLNVFEGEVYGIVGVSGSGKSTLLESIAGLQDPDKGMVQIKDLKTGQLRSPHHDDSVKWWVGFSPQQISLFPELTVRENLEVTGALWDMPRAQVLARMTELAKSLDLESILDTKVQELSKGTQKKADIACTILPEPRVIILDEPVRDLDPISRKEVYQIIRTSKEKGATIIVSSHAMDELAGVCTRMGVLHQGALVRSMSPPALDESWYEITCVTNTKEYQRYKDRLESAAIPALILNGSLVVHTTEPEIVLRFLLDSTQGLNEKLLGLQVSQPHLGEMFQRWVKP